jgi:hypothetical protein
MTEGDKKCRRSAMNTDVQRKKNCVRELLCSQDVQALDVWHLPSYRIREAEWSASSLLRKKEHQGERTKELDELDSTEKLAD